MTHTAPIAVLGAGSWGTALAIHLAHNDQEVCLWGRDVAQLNNMQTTRCNVQYLPNILFPEKLQIQTDFASTLKNAQDILLAVPSHAFRSTLKMLQPYIHDRSRIVWATKGLDPHSHQLLHEVVVEELGELPMAVLSGPTFAKEVAQHLPTAITLASQAPRWNGDLVTALHSKNFRIYTSTDVIGVEVSGAMKNVLAIAVGIADGLGLGANARAALVTRGLAEMTRLGMALGGQRDTFTGLAGLGDLVLTCTDNQSRNRRFGLAIGKGNNAQAAEKEIGQVVEGILTTKEIFSLAKEYNIEVPICEQVYNVLHENLSPQQAVSTLLSREQRKEGV